VKRKEKRERERERKGTSREDPMSRFKLSSRPRKKQGKQLFSSNLARVRENKRLSDREISKRSEQPLLLVHGKQRAIFERAIVHAESTCGWKSSNGI